MQRIDLGITKIIDGQKCTRQLTITTLTHSMHVFKFSNHRDVIYTLRYIQFATDKQSRFLHIVTLRPQEMLGIVYGKPYSKKTAKQHDLSSSYFHKVHNAYKYSISVRDRMRRGKWGGEESTVN